MELSMDGLTPFHEAHMQEIMDQLQTQDLQASLLARDSYQLTVCLNADAYQRKGLSTFLSQRFKIKLQQASLITILGQSIHVAPSWLDEEAILCSQWSEEVYQAAFLPKDFSSTVSTLTSTRLR